MSIANLFGGAGSIFSAQGDYQASKLYSEAASTLQEEIPIEKAEGQIAGTAQTRQTYQITGQNISAAGAGGAAIAGSAADILRANRAQGSLKQQLISAQTSITELGTQEQVYGAQAEAAAAEAAGNSAMASGVGGILGSVFSLLSG